MSWFLIKTKDLNLLQITIFFKFITKFCFSVDMPNYKITLNSDSQYFANYMFNTTRHSITNNHWSTIYSVEAWHLLYSLLHGINLIVKLEEEFDARCFKLDSVTLFTWFCAVPVNLCLTQNDPVFKSNKDCFRKYYMSLKGS